MDQPTSETGDKWALEPLGAHKNIFVVSIEGIIGTGKSTLVTRMKMKNMLKVELDRILGHTNVLVEYRLEPVWLWKSKKEGGNGMLDDFYKDKKANAYRFQVQVFQDHVNVVRKAIAPYLSGSGNRHCAGKPMVLVMERSMLSQLLFWRQQEADGYPTDVQRVDYMKLWQTWFQYIPAPKLYIILRIPHMDDNDCESGERLRRELRRVQRRVQERGRAEELQRDEDEDLFIPSQKFKNLSHKDMKQSLGDWDHNGQPLDKAFMDYNGKLLKRHETYWPNGTCNPEGMLKEKAACVQCDASCPYDKHDSALQKVTKEVAGYLSTFLIWGGYGPDMAASVHRRQSINRST